MSYLPLLQGFLTGAGLIIAIGAQNAFVLKQGLRRNHILATALFCSFSDALLIGIGVGGLGELLTSSRSLLLVAKWGGAAFLFWYGAKAFQSSLKAGKLQQSLDPLSHSLQKTLLTLAALTFLNPHVYLDTVVLLGSIGAQFEDAERVLFALGAMSSSFLWFFGLSFGAKMLAPLLSSRRAWQCIDIAIGCIMWGIAISVLRSQHLS